MKNAILFAATAIIFTLFANTHIVAQETKKEKRARVEAEVRQLITSQHYIFTAQTVNPAPRNLRNLSSGYDVKVSKDTIIAYLPYFGRAYTAPPIGTTDGGIKFTSTDFEYKLTERKKGGWDIEIQPEDAPETQKLNFTISEDGYTSLQVISTNRQPISFYGNITARKN